MKLPSRITWICLLIVCIVCDPAQAEQSHRKPVWPPGAEQPRVEFVKSVSRPADLGIGKSFIDRLSDILFGSTESRILRPAAVATSGEILFVADPGAKGVHRFDSGSGDYALVSADDAAGLPSPVGLARGASGDIYVSDSMRAQIFVIRSGTKSAVPLRLDIKLTRPSGIAFDSSGGRLYVVDTAEHRLHVFEADGSLAGSLGTRGSGDGEFNFPTCIWRTPDGRLYVTDSLNFRVQVFDARGHFLSKFGRQGDGMGDTARPKGVAIDRHGHVYVVDAIFHAFQIFDAEGRFLLPVGERGQEAGEFWLPAGIFIDSDMIYVADSYNQRVQVFRYVGGGT